MEDWLKRKRQGCFQKCWNWKAKALYCVYHSRTLLCLSKASLLWNRRASEMGLSFVLMCTQQNKCTANKLKFAEHFMCYSVSFRISNYLLNHLMARIGFLNSIYRIWSKQDFGTSKRSAFDNENAIGFSSLGLFVNHQNSWFHFSLKLAEIAWIPGNESGNTLVTSLSVSERVFFFPIYYVVVL